MVANQIDFYNEDYYYIVTHREENFRIESFDKLEKSSGILNKIYWMGNLICDQRRCQEVNQRRFAVLVYIDIY